MKESVTFIHSEFVYCFIREELFVRPKYLLIRKIINIKPNCIQRQIAFSMIKNALFQFTARFETPFAMMISKRPFKNLEIFYKKAKTKKVGGNSLLDRYDIFLLLSLGIYHLRRIACGLFLQSKGNYI